MKNINKTILAVIFASVSVLNCGLLEQEDRTLNELQLGFADFSDVATEPASGGASISRQETVQLIGAQRSSALNISYTIDESSTAEEGVHYTVTSSNPLVLDANTSSVELNFDLLDSPLSDGESATLIINLEDSEGIIAAPNFRTYTLTIEGAD